MRFEDLKLSTLSSGTYTIKAIFDGDETYAPAEAEFTLIIDANHEAHVVIPDNGSAEQGAKRYPSLAFAEATQTKTENTSHKYPLQQPVNPNMVDLVWSCSNPNVSIDENGKTISIPDAPLTCTITVTFNGNSLYYGATASYTLTIEETGQGTEPGGDDPVIPTPHHEEEEEDPRHYDLYFPIQMDAQEPNNAHLYEIQTPRTTETQSGTLPQEILNACYFTLDDSPTHIPVQSQMTIPSEGFHIITLHFTGTNDYDGYEIAYTLRVGEGAEQEMQDINLRWNGGTPITMEYNSNGTYTIYFNHDADTSKISQNEFTCYYVDNGSNVNGTLNLSNNSITFNLGNKKGSFNIHLEFAGNSYYNSDSLSGTLTVQEQQEQPQQLSISIPEQTLTYNSNNRYNITFNYTGDYSKLSSSDFSGTAARISGDYLYVTGTVQIYSDHTGIISVVLPMGDNANSVSYQVFLNFNGNSYYTSSMWTNRIFDIIESTPVQPTNYMNEPLTIESLEDSNTISFSINNSNISFNTLSFEWSYDKTNWNNMTIASYSEGGPIATLSRNSKIYIRGNNDNYYKYGFKSTKTFNVYGNIMSLMYSTTFTNTSLYNNYTWFAFRQLFANSKVVDASNLKLHPKYAPEYCYESMFAGCTSLTIAPELPAKQVEIDRPGVLGYSCYDSMFMGCTSLTKAPVLPSTCIGNAHEYYWMFAGCSSLNWVKIMVITDSTDQGNLSMNRMFDNVSQQGTFIINSSDPDIYPYSMKYMAPEGWTVQYASS